MGDTTMTEHKPTTEEVIDQYARYVDGCAGRVEARREVRRWLAAHDAEVAANALRKAADEMDHRKMNGWGDYYGASVVESIVDGMKARADRIEREAADHQPGGFGHISRRGCCPGCANCYGMSIGCHREPCACKPGGIGEGSDG